MTQRKKVIAVLMTALIVLSALSAAFSAAAEEQICRVTIELYGAGSVSDGTFTVNAPSVFEAEYTVGQSVVLHSEAGANKELVYWVNAESERIVSFSDSYSFSAGSDLYLYVDFEDTQAAAAQKNQHQVVYLSEGNNILYSETIAIGSTAYFASHVAPISLYINGKTWTGWDKTPEEVAAQTGRVFVRPTYTNTVSYSVTTIIDGVVSHGSGVYGTTYRVEAPAALNGEPFSYWVVPRDESDPNSADSIASYNRVHEFVLVLPITLQAVYGEEVTTGVATRVVGETHDFTNTAITFYTSRSVTNEYTVVESGILFTRDPSIGNLEDQLVLNTGNANVHQGKAETTSREGSYSVTVGSWYSVKDGTTNEYYYPLLYVRSYLIVTDSSGNATTHYSPIYCADYVNASFVGVILDNPHPDPF